VLETRRDEERRRVQRWKLSASRRLPGQGTNQQSAGGHSGQAQYLLRQLQVLDGPAGEIDNPVSIWLTSRLRRRAAQDRWANTTNSRDPHRSDAVRAAHGAEGPGRGRG
jgi:hypothetical protein